MPDDINLMLLSLLGTPEIVKMWWNSPNLAFGLLTPFEADQDKVLAYVKKVWA